MDLEYYTLPDISLLYQQLIKKYHETKKVLITYAINNTKIMCTWLVKI